MKSNLQQKAARKRTDLLKGDYNEKNTYCYFDYGLYSCSKHFISRQYSLRSRIVVTMLTDITFIDMGV